MSENGGIVVLIVSFVFLCCAKVIP